MRADLARRHRVAVGTVVGLAVADALASTTELPPTICGHRSGFLSDWGPRANHAFCVAEATCKNQSIAIDIDAASIAPSAVRLAANDSTPLLLADPSATAMSDFIRGAMSQDPAAADLSELFTTDLTDTIHDAAGYGELLTTLWNQDVPADQLAIAGIVGGVRWGPGSIPSAWVTYLAGPVGQYRYTLRQLTRLAERLLGEDAPTPPEPRRWDGPSEVAPKLWVSNMPAARRFAEQHPEGAIVSLCPTTGALDAHPIRREFVLHDASGARSNPVLGSQVDEILATIDAFHAEDRHVLVHCHHGASRTGLVLRAWLMRGNGLSLEDATAEAQARWPRTSTWNRAFTNELRSRE